MANSPQVPDYLIYQNDTIPTYNLLVEQYLQKIKGDNGKLFNMNFRNSIDGRLGGSLNCWRGYQAIYEIENDSLFVNNIIECHSLAGTVKDKPKSYLSEIFGEKVKNERVFLDWFTGKISFPTVRDDNLILRWDGVFEKIYHYEMVIDIDQGKIIELNDEENYIDLENGINRLKKDTISTILFEQLRNSRLKKNNKFDCSDEYLITILEDGKVGEIRMAWTDQQIKEFFTKREYNYCISLLTKSLSKLQFDIIKRKGEPLQETILLEIWLNDDGSIENWTN